MNRILLPLIIIICFTFNSVFAGTPTKDGVNTMDFLQEERFRFEPTALYSGLMGTRTFSGIKDSSDSDTTGVIGFRADLGGETINILMGIDYFSIARGSSARDFSEVGIYNDSEGILELYAGAQPTVVMFENWRAHLQFGGSYMTASGPSSDTDVNTASLFYGVGVEYKIGNFALGLDGRATSGASGKLFKRSVDLDYSQIALTLGYGIW